MRDPSQNPHYAYFARSYAGMETGMLLGLLQKPPTFDFNQPALLAELTARGFTDAQFEPHIAQGKSWSASRDEKDGEDGWNFLFDFLDPS